VSHAENISSVTPVEAVDCPGCGFPEGEVVDRSRAQLTFRNETFAFMRCDGCGLVRLSPRPLLSALPAFYDADYLPHRGARAWGRHAPLVARADAAVDRARCRVVEKAVALTADRRVLDVGCGRPTFLSLLRHRNGVAATGVDFAPDAWAGGGFEGLDLRAGTLDQVALEPGFHAITLWHALEHDPQPRQTLQQLRELAAPGAALVIEVPDHDSWGRRWQGPFWGGYHTPRHLVSYTPPALARLVEDCGWKVQRHQRWGTLDPYVLWWLGWQERAGRPACGDLEGRFAGFMAGKVALLPLTLLQRWVPLGVQLLVARAGS